MIAMALGNYTFIRRATSYDSGLSRGQMLKPQDTLEALTTFHLRVMGVPCSFAWSSLGGLSSVVLGIIPISCLPNSQGIVPTEVEAIELLDLLDF